jgi:hypothetical protein
MEPMARAVFLCGSQLFLWIPATIILGGLFGSLAALVVPRGRS